MSVYLDYNASAPIDERVLDKMIEVYKSTIGNADSRTHNHGEKAREVVEKARAQVADLIGVKPDEVFFTSGATESNNIAIQGLAEYAKKTQKKHIITSSIEHKAVLETVKEMGKRGFEVDFVSPDISGRVDANQILSLVREDTLLVSLMHVNNETGIIQPVLEVGQALSERGVMFHVDATQSCGKLVEEIRSMKYDMLSFSAHKLQGPQGIGVLILKKKGYKLPPVKNVMFGGQQEHGLRPGTVPVALVAGCGQACENALNEFSRNNQKCGCIKENILKAISESGLKYHINGNQDYCVNSTINVCIHGVNAEALMLSSREACSVSNGSACTSKNYSPSYVLRAMGIPEKDVENSVRISWGSESKIEEVSKGIIQLLEVAKAIAM